MNKVLKQIMIILLTVITVALMFAIIFYKFIPNNRVIPTKVPAYSTPESVETEIQETNTETEFASENQVYEITDSDLSLYQSKRSYNPGKSDPFREYSAEIDRTNNASNTQSVDTATSNEKSNNVRTTTEDKNITDNYYKSSGIGTGSK